MRHYATQLFSTYFKPLTALGSKTRILLFHNRRKPPTVITSQSVASLPNDLRSPLSNFKRGASAQIIAQAYRHEKKEVFAHTDDINASGRRSKIAIPRKLRASHSQEAISQEAEEEQAKKSAAV